MYHQFAKWTTQKIWFVTRMKDNADFHVTKVSVDKTRKKNVRGILIAQLLMVVIRKKAATKKSFANMITVIRLHLTSYIGLMEFIKNTYKAWRKAHDASLAFSP